MNDIKSRRRDFLGKVPHAPCLGTSEILERSQRVIRLNGCHTPLALRSTSREALCERLKGSLSQIDFFDVIQQ